MSHNVRKHQWADVTTGTGGDCGECIPCGVDDSWPIYNVSGTTWKLCRAVKSVSGACILSLAGEIVHIDTIEESLDLT